MSSGRLVLLLTLAALGLVLPAVGATIDRLGLIIAGGVALHGVVALAPGGALR